MDRESTLKIFDGMAASYDTKERLEVAKIISSEIEKQINGNDKNILIEYGAGTGLIGIELSKFFKETILIDNSQKMVNITNEKIKNSRSVSAIKMDFTDEKFLSLRADTVVISQVLLHVKEYEKLLNSALEILKVGGNLIVVDFVKDESIKNPLVHSGFTEEELKSSLSGRENFKFSYREFYTAEKLFMNKKATLFLAEFIK